jgi:hypothetical protein
MRLYFITYKMRGGRKTHWLPFYADSPSLAVANFDTRMGTFGAERGSYSVVAVLPVKLLPGMSLRKWNRLHSRLSDDQKSLLPDFSTFRKTNNLKRRCK